MINDVDEEETCQNHIHLLDQVQTYSYLTKRDYDNDMDGQKDHMMILEIDDYKKGY